LSDSSIPMWIVKTRGQTYYIKHVKFENVSFETKETPENGSTKGSLKIKGFCEIYDDGTAKIWQRE
jgi:hypothetical protein